MTVVIVMESCGVCKIFFTRAPRWTDRTALTPPKNGFELGRGVAVMIGRTNATGRSPDEQVRTGSDRTGCEISQPYPER